MKQEIEERIAAEVALQKLAEELEKRVEERTAELSEALDNLKNAQVQIVQNEKMASLGQLLAGIAHEINNPVNFISSNLPSAKDYISDLIAVMLDDSRVVIRIADNGPGIKEEARQQLFKPMFTTKSVGKGTGLGLSISIDIVEKKHGGKLTCISSPGEGAEFVIDLPIHH